VPTENKRGRIPKAVDQKRKEQDVDVQASKVLNGLRELGDLLDEPSTGEALDLAKNARTTEQYNILRRLRQSLTQYLERDGDLFYVGLVGHFSSGKSSTINSVLGAWGTDRERETDLNPTDTTITLITSEGNAKSLLGVIREGHVTIRHESVNNELLNKVVIADTPGSGDTQFVEEVARDFLPICDVILFFFSATSPLDKTDLPLLTELHKRLRFIPIRFVVTRADEFRLDVSKPVSDNNIDTARRDRFLGDVLTRLNKLLQPTIYTEEQFILIDNKAPPYNIEKIVELIRTKCDPANPRARVVMHGHKLHYFQSTAKELKTFFGNFIDDKLRQLTKIVDTAEQNIRLYNDNVLISNNNLTKNWLDQLSSIRAIRERTLKSLPLADPIPQSADNFETVSKRRVGISKSLVTEAQFMARQINLKVRLEISRNLRSRVEQMKLWELGSSDTTPTGVAFNLIEIDPDSLLPLVPSNIASDWTSLRETKAYALREAAADLRRLTSQLATLIDERTPIREYETEVNNAQHSLTVDLNQFFRNAELYRDGVFSHTTKESISTLGIGARLDALESEFTANDTMSFTSETMQTLFPDFSEVTAKGLTNFAALANDATPLIDQLSDLKISSPVTGTRDIYPTIDAIKSELVSLIIGQLRDDVQHLGGRLDIQLSGAIAERNRQYEADLRTAQRRRQWRYAAITLGTACLAFAGYLFYAFLNRDVPQDMFNSVIWNLVAETIAICVGVFIARWRDDFPKTKNKILEDSRAILRGDVFSIVDKEFQSHEFAALNESNLSNKLIASYNRIVEADPDGWNQIAAERIEIIRRFDTEYRRLRSEYEKNMEEVFEHASSYFSDASKNLGRLNEVAARVKARAIEPSFQLLASTRESLDNVRKQIRSVEFNV
jgi:predicted GTPase